MTETQYSVAGGADAGDPKARYINFATVIARGYNVSAASPQGKLRKNDD